jgi:transcription antitermination factor NusG
MVDSSAVVRLVGFRGVVMPIDDEEIESVRILSDSGCNVQPHHGLVKGQKVIVLSGPLMGAHGVFVGGGRDENWIFVQVMLFQRSVRVCVEPDAVAVVSMNTAWAGPLRHGAA